MSFREGRRFACVAARSGASVLAILVVAWVWASGSSADGQGRAHYRRVYRLRPREGVFAYSRISPDGRYLAYAAEAGNARSREGPRRTVIVVNLRTGKRVFAEEGVDAYWSPDSERMIFLSTTPNKAVNILNITNGKVVRGIAPPSLGDYLSWARRDGKDMIVTIEGNYYFLDSDVAVLPARSIPSCRGIGTGERPLVSKDGRRVTTFVRGMIVVRDLDDCDRIVQTQVAGAKADFSWDGRYIAFHAQKQSQLGYEIRIIDLQLGAMTTLAELSGSSFYPSWTRDGRLSFRYDASDFRGFVVADNVLSNAWTPLAGLAPSTSEALDWSQMFPASPEPVSRFSLVLVWAPWGAHCPQALVDLQRASELIQREHINAAVFTAAEPSSAKADVDRVLVRSGVALPQLPLDAERLHLTAADNQIPTTLLFAGTHLLARRLGAQSYDDLLTWMADVGMRHSFDPRRGDQ